MVTAWRMVWSHHASSTFDGEGARRFGGRWNSRGTAVVYASGSRALVLLEVLSGLGAVGALAPYVLIGVRFPESLVAALDPEELPESWRAYPPPAAVQYVGDDWIRGGTSPVLRVPSVIVPEECNYVLNPRHPEFGRLGSVGRRLWALVRGSGGDAWWWVAGTDVRPRPNVTSRSPRAPCITLPPQ